MQLAAGREEIKAKKVGTQLPVPCVAIASNIGSEPVDSGQRGQRGSAGPKRWRPHSATSLLPAGLGESKGTGDSGGPSMAGSRPSIGLSAASHCHPSRGGAAGDALPRVDDNGHGGQHPAALDPHGLSRSDG